MAFLINATIRFTGCRSCAMDPITYPELETELGRWKRFERTMNGERKGPNGTYLTDWETASDRQKRLAGALDRLVDSRPFLNVGLFDGIYERFRHIDPVEPEPQGILIMVVIPEPWQRDGVPSRHCSIDWIDAGTVTGQTEIQQRVDLMLEDLSYIKEILEIRTYLIDTESGGTTELGYEIPIPGQLTPAA